MKQYTCLLVLVVVHSLSNSYLFLARGFLLPFRHFDTLPENEFPIVVVRNDGGIAVL